MNSQRIAVIRVRGETGVMKKIKYTLHMLRLYKKNNCIILKNTPSHLGFLHRIKDYVTWGELDKTTFKELIEKRGRIISNKPFTESYLKEKTNQTLSEFIEDFFVYKKEIKDVPGLKLFFRLNPPRKGFEKKGVKKPFSLGGALGYRKEKINDLIKRML